MQQAACGHTVEYAIEVVGSFGVSQLSDSLAIRGMQARASPIHLRAGVECSESYGPSLLSDPEWQCWRNTTPINWLWVFLNAMAAKLLEYFSGESPSITRQS